jgi:HAD superfamily hydrolase (TIGR01509 family)
MYTRRKRMNIDYMDTLKVVIFDYDETIRVRNKDIHPDVKNIIKCLVDNGFKIALASLNMNAPLNLHHDNLYHLFDFIQYRTNRKNLEKLEMFENILEYFKVEPHECLLFDDHPYHCNVAKKRGMKVVHVDGSLGILKKDVGNLV